MEKTLRCLLNTVLFLLVLSPFSVNAAEGEAKAKDEMKGVWPFTEKKNKSVEANAENLSGCDCEGVPELAKEARDLYFAAKEKYIEGNEAAAEAEGLMGQVTADATAGNVSTGNVGQTEAATAAVEASIKAYEESKKLLEEAIAKAKEIPGKLKEECAKGKLDSYKSSAEKLVGMFEWVLERVEKTIAGGEETAEALAETAATEENFMTKETMCKNEPTLKEDDANCTDSKTEMCTNEPKLEKSDANCTDPVIDPVPPVASTAKNLASKSETSTKSSFGDFPDTKPGDPVYDFPVEKNANPNNGFYQKQ